MVNVIRNNPVQQNDGDLFKGGNLAKGVMLLTSLYALGQLRDISNNQAGLVGKFEEIRNRQDALNDKLGVLGNRQVELNDKLDAQSSMFCEKFESEIKRLDFDCDLAKIRNPDLKSAETDLINQGKECRKTNGTCEGHKQAVKNLHKAQRAELKAALICHRAQMQRYTYDRFVYNRYCKK